MGSTPEEISKKAAEATMAPLSPDSFGAGKKTSGCCSPEKRLRSSWLAETPPAKTMEFVSGCLARARVSFSWRMSMAVFSKLAAKSEIC